MLATVLTFVQAHGLVYLVAAFTFLSALLSAIAILLQSFGESVPGWLGTIISFCGTAIHFLNGNFSPAKKQEPQ